MSKYIYIHGYMVGSGNSQKLKESIYPESMADEAREQQRLLGGYLMLAEILSKTGELLKGRLIRATE